MDNLNTSGDIYKYFLDSAQFPYSTAEQNCIKNTVNKLFAQPTKGSHPGMLLGKIQSGKTKTFMAIIGLAFDNGYQVSVVFTKGTKALSKQTEQRIQKDFSKFIENDDLLVFDIMNMPLSLYKAFHL